jgi:hypothetical protein
MTKIPKTYWTTAGLLSVWLLCWIPAGVFVWVTAGTPKSRDPLDWIAYLMLIPTTALVFVLLVAGLHPGRFGWFDRGRTVLPQEDSDRLS